MDSKEVSLGQVQASRRLLYLNQVRFRCTFRYKIRASSPVTSLFHVLGEGNPVEPKLYSSIDISSHPDRVITYPCLGNASGIHSLQASLDKAAAFVTVSSAVSFALSSFISKQRSIICTQMLPLAVRIERKKNVEKSFKRDRVSTDET